MVARHPPHDCLGRASEHTLFPTCHNLRHSLHPRHWFRQAGEIVDGEEVHARAQCCHFVHHHVLHAADMLTRLMNLLSCELCVMARELMSGVLGAYICNKDLEVLRYYNP